MSAPASLSGELLVLVAGAQAHHRRAYAALHAANERGVTGDDLEAFSTSLRLVHAVELEIRACWFPRAAEVYLIDQKGPDAGHSI